MSEDILQFIWKYQYLMTPSLRTVTGSSVQVLDPGFHNKDSGPDFSHGKLLLDELEWHGNIEVHFKSSDWYKHNHHKDKAYDSTVLHVVWEQDKIVTDSNGVDIPAIELKDVVDKEVLGKAKTLLSQSTKTPCEQQLNVVSPITVLSMKERAVMERLETKGQHVLSMLDEVNGDWEEVAYQQFFKSLGFKTNSCAFQQLAERLPFKILKKHTDDIMQLEALLFGMAGFLEEGTEEEYHSLLKSEYAFLQSKYELENKHLSLQEWKFSKIRPGNFPTLRIAQAAAFIAKNSSVFSTFIKIEPKQAKKEVFAVETSVYWTTHYHFLKESKIKEAKIGMSSIESIMINACVPLLVAYSNFANQQSYLDKAVQLLESISVEKNHIINYWKQQGVGLSSALDSQGLIQLYNCYCSKKKCLSCSIGTSLIRNKS